MIQSTTFQSNHFGWKSTSRPGKVSVVVHPNGAQGHADHHADCAMTPSGP